MVICLFLPGPDSAARVMVGDSGLSVRSRATAFLERSTTMARRVIAGDYAINGKDCFINDGEQYGLSTASYGTRITGGPPTYDDEKIVDPERLNATFHTRFHELDAALQTFSNSLPVLTPEDLSEVVNPTYLASLTPENDIDMTGEELYDLAGGWCPRRSARTHTIITGHSLALAASMQLHFLLSETRPESHRRVLEDAMRTAELSRITNDVDPRNFQLTATVRWVPNPILCIIRFYPITVVLTSICLFRSFDPSFRHHRLHFLLPPECSFVSFSSHEGVQPRIQEPQRHLTSIALQP